MNEVPYKEAGEVGRATLYWATHADLSRSEMKVVVGVVALTALHSKVEDTVALSQVAMHAGLSTRQTSRILKSLTRREGSPIEYEPGGKGHGVRSTVRLRKDDIITPYRGALAQLKGDTDPPNDVALAQLTPLGDNAPPNDVHLKGDNAPPNDVHLDESRVTSAKSRVTSPRLAATSPSTSSEKSRSKPRARAKSPNPNPGICPHGNVDTIAEVCPTCQDERRAAKARALGGRSLMDAVRDAMRAADAKNEAHASSKTEAPEERSTRREHRT